MGDTVEQCDVDAPPVIACRGEVVTLNVVRCASLALKRPLMFRPPMMELASNGSNFIFWWKLLAFVFEPPDPSRFPALGPFSPQETRVLQRFVHACEQLATSRLINYPIKSKLQFGQGTTEESFIDRPDDEVMRGALTLFRQIYVGSEPASFGTVKNIIARRARDSAGERGAEALRQIAVWVKAHSDLERAPLPMIADEAVMAFQDGRERAEVDWPDFMRPRVLVETYAYGDFIHWGERVDERQAFGSSPTMEVMAMGDLLDVICGFGHLYMGFARAVEQAMNGARGPFGRAV